MTTEYTTWLRLRKPDFRSIPWADDVNTNWDDIDAALKSEGEAIWIYTKDPSVEAFKTLMDRALDKPKEQALEVNVTLSLEERIKAADARINGKS